MTRATLFVGLAMVMLPILDPEVHQTSAGTQTVDAVLTRARAWVGADGLASIRSLSVVGRQGPRGQNAYEANALLMLPDRYQSQGEGFVHTIVGRDYWMSGPIVGSPEAEKTARSSSEHHYLTRSMAFLLRPPPLPNLALTHVPRAQVGTLVGEGISARLGERPPVTFVFEPSGRPLGFGYGPASQQVVVKLLDYRLTGGVRMPFHLEMTVSPAGSVVDWIISSVSANAIDAKTFDRPR